MYDRDVMTGLDLLLTGLIFVPMVFCAVQGVQKRRRWYWFALLGLLSFPGMLIASLIPMKNDERSITERFPGVPIWRLRALRDASLVRASRSQIDDATYIGAVSIDLFEPLPGQSSGSPEFGLAVDALRLCAAELGANAISQVTCARTDSLQWSTDPQTVYRIHGVACMVEESVRAIPSDADDLEPESYVSDAPAFADRIQRGAQQSSWAVARSLPRTVTDRGPSVAYQSLMRFQAEARTVGRFRRGAEVRLSCEAIGDPSERLDRLTVSERVDFCGGGGVDIGLLLDCLRSAAADLGANAVASVSCVQMTPRIWEDSSLVETAIGGTPVRLADEQLAGLSGDSRRFEIGLCPVDRMTAVRRSMTRDGVQSLTLAAICAVGARFCAAAPSLPESALGWTALPPEAAYVLLGIQAAVAIAVVVTRNRRVAIGLARVTIVAGIGLMVCPWQAIFGACEIGWGISKLIRRRPSLPNAGSDGC